MKMIDQKEVLMENNFDIKEIIESRLPFWEDLSLPDRDLILSQITRQKFDKGMVVNRDFEGCQGAMILLSGQLRTYIVSEEGREVTLYRLRAGENCVLSAACLLDAITFEVIIQAAEDSDMLVIPTNILNKII